MCCENVSHIGLNPRAQHLLSNPRERAQYRDNDKDVGDDAASDNSWMLDCAIPNNVNDLVH